MLYLGLFLSLCALLIFIGGWSAIEIILATVFLYLMKWEGVTHRRGSN